MGSSGENGKHDVHKGFGDAARAGKDQNRASSRIASRKRKAGRSCIPSASSRNARGYETRDYSSNQSGLEFAFYTSHGAAGQHSEGPYSEGLYKSADHEVGRTS